MSLVQDPPRPDASASTSADGSAQRRRLPDPQEAVIEDARRRQRRRRNRFAVVATFAIGVIALAFALIEASNASPAHTGTAAAHAAASATHSGRPEFNVRLAPGLEAGRVSWRLSFEEHGVQAGGVEVGPAVSSDPIIAGASNNAGGSHRWITILVTTANVASILVEGKKRVPTVTLPGLPYRFRAARIVTAITPAEERIPAGVGRRDGPGPFVPLDAQGRPIHYKARRLTPSQGTMHRWEYPAATPAGSCGLRAGGLGGLTAQGGTALGAVRPYPAKLVGGQIAGHAFLSCVSVRYRLHGLPLEASLLLDAAHPGARAAALPDFRPVRGAPGFLEQGGLTARREGPAWLLVGQGSGVAQRVDLLRHLSALVKLGSSVPASSGVPEVGEGNAPPPPIRPAKVRVAPALEAGALGWELFETDVGGGSGGSCCSLLTQPAELISVTKDIGHGSGSWWTGTLITAPEVAEVSVEGRAPVRTRSGGLPYGMRFAAVALKNADATPVAFDAGGQRITARGVEPQPKRHELEGPYASHPWTAPGAPPPAVCELSASGLPGVAPLGGDVVLHVKGYRIFESRAFQSCADTYYGVGGSTLEAAVLLDAEHPGATPASLPYMTAAIGATGVFEEHGGGVRGGRGGSRDLTAERLHGAWLVVTGGKGHGQQLELLRHLHVKIHV